MALTPKSKYQNGISKPDGQVPASPLADDDTVSRGIQTDIFQTRKAPVVQHIARTRIRRERDAAVAALMRKIAKKAKHPESEDPNEQSRKQ